MSNDLVDKVKQLLKEGDMFSSGRVGLSVGDMRKIDSTRLNPRQADPYSGTEVKKSVTGKGNKQAIVGEKKKKKKSSSDPFGGAFDKKMPEISDPGKVAVGSLASGPANPGVMSAAFDQIFSRIDKEREAGYNQLRKENNMRKTASYNMVHTKQGRDFLSLVYHYMIEGQ